MSSRKSSDDDARIDFVLSWEPFGEGKRAVAHDVKPGEEASAAVAVATLQGHLDGSPLPPPQPANAPTLQKTTGKKISDIWESYKAEKINLGQQRGVKGGWKDGEDTAKYDHWPHVRALIEFLGDQDIGHVTAEGIIAFQQEILTDPEGGLPRNRQKRLQRAGAVFRWAKARRLISDDFKEFFRYPGKIEDNPYLKFNNADLKALFESDEYKNHLFKKPSEYWLMVLALFTGARLNELCQLTVGDIGTHDGVETISILDGELKRLKTTASRRIVPIHSKLIELGFLDFVATTKAGRIFPELPESPVKAGDFGREPSRKFTEYRRQVGVGEDRLNADGKWEGDNRKVFHSFRSTLIAALRTANVPKDRRTRLAGHDYDDTQDKHYTGGDVLTMFDFKTLKADIECVKFDVDFTPYQRAGVGTTSLEGHW
ncbi:MAG: hypothetical protein H6R10_3173 [Rhodocyclaceae bacterium]|nr:hypothetical protein [Rhodocyclaceae bacterium]